MATSSRLYDSERELAHLERMLASMPGRGRTAAMRQAQDRIVRLFYRFADDKRAMAEMSPEIRHSLGDVYERLKTASKPDDLLEATRDMRRVFEMSVGFGRTRALEERLFELERQLEFNAQKAASGTGDEDGVVTIEKLKTERVLFAIMPFAAEMEDVWTGGIVRAAQGTGLKPIRIDMITATSEITDDIVAAIELAEVVVVDVTGNNPNVMFEFGFALARGKPHAVISQSTEFLTFDIKNLRTIIYKNSWQGIERLHKDLQAFVKSAVNKPAAALLKPAKKRGTRKAT